MNRYTLRCLVAGLYLALLVVGAGTAHAVSLTWDANGATAGQTNGAGAWLDANKWWDGSTNVTWTSGDDATFGVAATAGGAVTLASPTTVGMLTFNQFTGTYTLGTAGQTITLNDGINKTSASAAATIISPISLGAAQSWTNNSTGLLTVGTGLVDNGGFLLTVDGSGNTTISGAILGAGGITKTGAGLLTLSSNANQFTGTTLISDGKVKLGAQYALWKSAYDTTGATGAIGLDATGQVTPVLGGLVGSVDLLTAITAFPSMTGLTLNPQTGASNTYSGVIADGAGNMKVTKTGPGTQILTGANTYAGATTVYAGTLALGGASGSILYSAVTVRGGTLLLDNTTTWNNRIADGSNLSLGSLTLTSSDGAGSQYEFTGATTFATSGKITVNNGATSGDMTTLALGAVTRSAGAAIDFVGTGGTLGGGADSPNVTSSSLPANANGILPWATVGGTQWAENNFNSIRAYSGTFVDPTTAASDATANAQLTGSGTLDSAKSFNSLNVIASGAGQGLSLTGGNLTLTGPGAILKSGADAYTISSSNGNITAGTELIAHVDGGDLTISAPLNTAIVNIAKGGTGKLILSGTRAATMSGAISISGTLEFQGAQTTLSGAISGPGGLIVNLNPGQKLIFQGYNKTYSGPTVVKGGVLQLGTGWNGQSWPTTGTGTGAAGGDYSNQGQNGLSNIELNGGNIAMWYYCSWFLGSGPGQVQITGGKSGFSNYQGDAGGNMMTLNNDANYEVVWGSTYFNPSTFALQDSTMTANSSYTFFKIPNKFDLNGATRTIAVDSSPTATTYSGTHLGGYLTGVIRDSQNAGAGLIKTGIGVLQLDGANTFTGPVTVNQGILWVGSIANGGVANPLGMSSNAAANLLLANGTTLKYTGSAASTDRSFTINGTAAGDGVTLDASGSGAVNWTNTASPAYGTADQARTLTLTGSNTGNNTLAANLADNGTGAVSVTKTGAGLWVLSGANSYTGPTTLNAGTLSVGASNNLGDASSNLVFNGGALQITGTTLTNFSGIGHTVVFNPNATVGLDINSAANTFTADQVLNQGGGGLTKAGTGALVLNQANTYTGPTTISAGTLQLNDGGAMSLAPLLDNGTFAVNRSGTATLGIEIPAIISGAGSVTNVGTGTLVLNAPTYYTGTTKATAGAITLSHAQAIQNSALDTTGAGTVTLSGVTTPTFGGLSGASGDLGTGGVLATGYSGVTALTLNPQSGVTFTYGGVIANGASGMTLTKTGAGTQVLQGVSTYTGATTLVAGTLELSGSGSILNTAITFSGGELKLTNTAAETSPGRLADAAGITSNGGALTYNNTSGANVYAETIGPVALASGQLNIVEAVNQAGAGSQTLTLSGLTQSGSAAVTFSAASTAPNATKNMIAVSGASQTPTGQIIGPWATTGTTAANQTDYAVYNASAQVVPAAIAASAETTWTTATNAYTFNAAPTLTATRTITALRNSGAALTLALGANNLETYGLLNGGTGLLTVSGTGALTTPSGGGSLFLTAGNNAITVSAPINDNGGPVTLVKSGSGALTLSGANSYTGGTVINGPGTVTISAANNLATGDVTANSSFTLASGSNVNLSCAFALNNGAILAYDIGANNGDYTISGAVTGNGGIKVTDTLGLKLTSTGNTFTGPITMGNGIYAGRLYVSSIGDAPGAGTIQVGSATGYGAGTFQWDGASPLTLNYRQIDVASPSGSANIVNNNASTTNIITVNTDLLSTIAGTKTLVLGGTNTGSNLIAGKIVDGTGLVNLTKSGAGTWVLSGVNTYSGATSITGGKLSINSIANVGGGASAVGNPTTVANGAISIGSGGTAATLQYTGSGHSSNRAINLAGTTGGATLDASGTGALVLTSDFTATGTGSKTLTLTGESIAANTIAGAIVDNSGTNKTSLTKSGSGTWVLSGANTYTGATTVSAGTLVAANTGGSATGAGTVTLNGGTLASGAAGSIAGPVTAGSGAHTVAPGGVGSVGALSLTNAGTALTLKGNSTLDFDLIGNTCDQLSLSGALAITSGAPMINLNFSGSQTALSYTLASYATSPGIGASSFILPMLMPTGYSWDITDTYIKLVGSVPPASVWSNGTGNKKWNDAGNWDGGIPNAVGAVAQFGIAAAEVTVDTNVTLGTMQFTTTNNYNISGANSITLQTAAGSALIDLQWSDMTHSITAPLIVASDATIAGPSVGTTALTTGNISTDAGKTLTIDSHVGVEAGAISGAGSTAVNGSLTANSIVQDTLTIGAGGSVVIRETPVAAGGASAVPEPGAWALVGIGLLSLLALRRRR